MVDGILVRGEAETERLLRVRCEDLEDELRRVEAFGRNAVKELAQERKVRLSPCLFHSPDHS